MKALDPATLPDHIKKLNPEWCGNPMGTKTSATEAVFEVTHDAEKALQRLCELELSRRGIWYLHLSPRAREKAGTPDILCCVKGKAWAIELKSQTGRLSHDQANTMQVMKLNGWHTAVVRSYEEFREVVFGENAAGEVRRNAVTSTGLLGTSGVE